MTTLLASTGDAGSPWWIAAIEALVIVNLVLFTFAYLKLRVGVARVADEHAAGFEDRVQVEKIGA